MLYEEFIRDFAIRTEANLLFIEKESKNNDALYEVTQLINSTLGLLIFPVEEYIIKLKEIGRLDDSEIETTISRIKIIKGTKNLTIDEFLRRLRNAFAHNNIKVRGGREIECLIIWNQYDRTRPVNWKAEVKIPELREVLLLVSRKLKQFVIDVAA